MALKGSIKEFGLPEILQLIFHQNKDGVLTLEKDKNIISILFKEGNVIKAYEGNADEKFGESLVKAKILSDDQLAIGRDRLGSQNKTLEDALEFLEFVSSDELMRLIRLFTEETIFNVFDWKNGDYKFVQKQVYHNQALAKPLDTQFILMEAARQMDEWPFLLKKISSREAVFEKIIFDDADLSNKKVVPVSQDNEAEDFFGSIGDDDSHENEEDTWLFDTIDGEQTVQEIIDQARFPAFSIYQGLNDLLAEKKISEKAKAAVDLNKRKRSSRQPIEKILKNVVGGGVSLFVIVLFVLSYPSFHQTSLNAARSLQEIKDLSIINERFFIRYALDLYYLKYNQYPGELRALAKEGFFGNKKEIINHLEAWSYHLEAENRDNFKLEPI